MSNKMELHLENGESLTLELKYNPIKCMKIARDFPMVNDAFTMAVGEKVAELSIPNLYNAVYVAYRQANMNDYISFDEFVELWDFEMKQATQIYYSMIDKNTRVKYLEDLARLAKK